MQNKINIDYRVVTADSEEDLALKVNELCKDGFMPQGGIGVGIRGSQTAPSAMRGGGVIHQNHLVFTQAVVLVTPEVAQ